MKVSDADILMVPGFGNSGRSIGSRAGRPGCRRRGASRWPTGSRPIAPSGQGDPRRRVGGHAAGDRRRPFHRVAATAHAAPGLAGKVVGAFLVAPSDWDKPDLLPGVVHDFAPIPLVALPFPSVLVASSDDPYCTMQRASDFAEAWGSEFVSAGEAGISTSNPPRSVAGRLMKFAGFLSKLA